MGDQITVHPLTNNPTAAWMNISQQQKIIRVNVKPPTKPVEPNKVRFVCMSDTHSLIQNIKFDVPDGDVLLHAGDFTKCGESSEVQEFDRWLGNTFTIFIIFMELLSVLGTLPHKHKVVIAGNHELSFDPAFASMFKKNFGHTSRHMGSKLDDDILGNCGTFLNIFKKTNTYKSNKETTETITEAVSTDNIRKYLTNCIYLEDSAIEIYGIKIYGSPW